MSSIVKRQRLSSSLRQQPSLLALAKERRKASHHHSTTKGSSNWSQLPLELLVYILNYLENKDRRQFFLVCTHWSKTANVPSLWVESWIFMKSYLSSKSAHFWNLINHRCYNKVALYGYGVSNTFEHLDKDLILLHSNLPHLRGLSINWASNHVTPNGFKRLLKFKDLQELKLDFKRCHFLPLSMLFDLELRGLNNLKCLSLTGITIVKDCDFLFHPSLSSLSIDSCGTLRSIDTYQLISNYPELCKLSITNCHYYGPFIKEYKNPNVLQSSLSEVCLARTLFNGAQCNLPKWFCRISTLDLSFCKQTHKQLSHLLSQLQHLVTLNLTGNFCVDTTLSTICSPALQSIDLSFNQDITVNGLHNLSLIVGLSLANLSLSHCSGLVSKREDILSTMGSLFPRIKSLDIR